MENTTNNVDNISITAYKERVLYNGTINMKFYPSSHRYIVNGKRVSGVTSYTGYLAKPALVYWSANLACDYLLDRKQEILATTDEMVLRDLIETARKQFDVEKKRSAALGSFTHSYIESYIEASIKHQQFPALPQNEEIRNSCQAFIDWVGLRKPTFHATELIVYSKKYNYAGMLDAVAVIDGKRYLIDFKTSNGLYAEYALQLTAYRMAEEEERGRDEYDGCILLQLPKNGEAAVEKIVSSTKKEYEDHKNTFLCLYHLRNRMLPIESDFYKLYKK
jgi:ATP-dependent exoDNAse (exonuclease V) beta subunit